MEATFSPVQQFIQDMVPQLANHFVLLRQIALAVDATRGDVLAQWKNLLEPPRELTGLGRFRLPEVLQHALTVLSDGLLRGSAASMQNYLFTFAEWSGESYAAGMDYADQYALWATYRRTLLPILLREFQAGPELSLAFNALDAQERAVMGLLGLMGIQVAREQLTQGVHQRALGRLTGGLTHALNNTMAVIVGRAQIVEEQITDETQRDELRTIQRIARAGAESLKRLQHFAENDEREVTRLDVNAIVQDVIQLTRFRWRDAAEASGISIDVVKDLETVPPVLGQGALLRDALVELILNSVEAMPLGGLVTIRTERTEDQVVILIIDQGAGMDESAQVRAFEPFFTTKGSAHVGLGLPTVVNTVRQLNGTLTMASATGQGTTVRVALPIAPSVLTGDTRQARLARWANILIVDDEPLVRDVAARTFILRGFHAVAADSGADAMRLMYEQGPFQVAIVDLGMPGMNGFELARAIKDHSPKTIVILLTGWAAELDVKKMRESGIDRAIAKPFDAEQVIQLISEALAIQEKL